jgi:PncC family amidohydrolase
MSVGVRQRFLTDVGLSTTGVAGPDGGTEKKPVGLVYIGLADAQDCRVGRYRFSGTREDVRRAAVDAALEMLKAYL